LIGTTIDEAAIYVGSERISLSDALAAWQRTLSKVFPEKISEGGGGTENISYFDRAPAYMGEKFAAPRVFIPVFPGTNCEYDTEKAFAQAGAKVSTMVIKNLSSHHISESARLMKKYIDGSQIVMIPGGFSGGDEPDGSGKFIATAFRNPQVSESVMKLLNQRDGLILGICNGFQALIKLGLVPYGEIRDMDENSPTLTFNKIGRHMSAMVRTRISSVKSPWLAGVNVGDVHTVAISHGEGRFTADEKTLSALIQNGQIATQYVDFDGNAASDMPHNPNGSVMAVEGITSPDGRVFGKMAHSERYGKNVFKNIPGEKDQKIFISGVQYFG
jgi:phosphoribosylformylglycinamidine synthase